MLPPRTILTAVDFSDTSRTALMLAARLARHSRAELHVLHAEEPLLRAAADHAGIDLARETREELQRFIASAWPAAEASSQMHVAVGPAVDVILDVVARLRVDLVVVGSRGISGAQKLVFGSTTEGLLRRSAVPVLVAPHEWKPPQQEAADLSGVGPLIVGIDFSEPSLAAAKGACTLASTLGASVELVHVVPDLPVLSRWRAHAEAAVRDRVGAARHELEGTVRSLGCAVPVKVRVEAGGVPNLLAQAAEPTRDRAPILVLGKKAPASKGAAPGTIAYRVLSLASVPVLMYVAD